MTTYWTIGRLSREMTRPYSTHPLKASYSILRLIEDCIKEFRRGDMHSSLIDSLNEDDGFVSGLRLMKRLLGDGASIPNPKANPHEWVEMVFNRHSLSGSEDDNVHHYLMAIDRLDIAIGHMEDPLVSVEVKLWSCLRALSSVKKYLKGEVQMRAHVLAIGAKIPEMDVVLLGDKSIRKLMGASNEQ